MRHSLFFALIPLLFLMPACSPSPSAPALAPQDIIATNVAATFAVIPTVTPLPSSTLAPSATPTRRALPPTDWPTQPVFPSVTPLYTSTPLVAPTAPITTLLGITQKNGNFSCQILSKNPDDGKPLQAGLALAVSWRVKNTGPEAWRQGNVQLRYVEGDSLQATGDDIYGLNKAVKVNDAASFSVNITTPTKPGTYRIMWGLFDAEKMFCKLPLTFVIAP